jgi:hypothetical protein
MSFHAFCSFYASGISPATAHLYVSIIQKSSISALFAVSAAVLAASTAPSNYSFGQPADRIFCRCLPALFRRKLGRKFQCRQIFTGAGDVQRKLCHAQRELLLRLLNFKPFCLPLLNGEGISSPRSSLS